MSNQKNESDRDLHTLHCLAVPDLYKRHYCMHLQILCLTLCSETSQHSQTTSLIELPAKKDIRNIHGLKLCIYFRTLVA